MECSLFIYLPAASNDISRGLAARQEEGRLKISGQKAAYSSSLQVYVGSLFGGSWASSDTKFVIEDGFFPQQSA